MLFMQGTNQNVNCWDFWVLGSKFTKFLSVLKQQISFSWTFASRFSVMRHNSSVLFYLKFYILSTKEPIKVQIWRNRKPEIWCFDGLPSSKWYKVSAKKVQKSYLSWHCRVTQSLKKKWFVVSNMTSKVPKFYFDGLFLSKVYEVWAKKIQRSYLSWHWTVMQNLNKPWTCGFKNGMRNWVNFHYSTQKSEKLYIDGLFLSKGYNVSARKFQMGYESWHWTVYIAKFIGKLTCGLKNGISNLESLHFDVLLFSIAYKVSAKKSTEELSLITLRKDANFEEKLTFCLKNDITNLVNFNPSSGKSENFHFDGLLLWKVCNFLAKKIQRNCVVRNDLYMFSKMAQVIWWIFTQVVESNVRYYLDI